MRDWLLCDWSAWWRINVWTGSFCCCFVFFRFCVFRRKGNFSSGSKNGFLCFCGCDLFVCSCSFFVQLVAKSNLRSVVSVCNFFNRGLKKMKSIRSRLDCKKGKKTILANGTLNGVCVSKMYVCVCVCSAWCATRSVWNRSVLDFVYIYRPRVQKREPWCAWLDEWPAAYALSSICLSGLYRYVEGLRAFVRDVRFGYCRENDFQTPVK